MARAICTRCARPPDNCGGKRLCALRHELGQKLQRSGFGVRVREATVAAVEVKVLIDRSASVERIELRDNSK